MKAVPLKAVPRTATRRSGTRKVRASGYVPAVIYGRHIRTQNLQVARKELENLLHHTVSENILLDLTIEGDRQPRRLALLQEIQRHPLSGAILHVDFHEVAENEKVTMYVPVETVGEAAGVKTGGGILEHVLFRVKVRALPKDLPEQIVVDVTHLQAGQTIHLGELPVPPGVEVLGEKTAPVITISVPRAEAEEAAAAAAPAEAGAVEMIKEKKEAPAAESTEKAAAEKAEKKAEKPAGGEKTEKEKKK
ncbi:MAG: 50S ribosomal protein L25 [Verrucomicrobiota bacterium]|nr:50S ribosomal protein L25 [Limisphaera sp.]MDW8381848.1 50S ribosomal protein L25 [Verrucomicrobiota bacterium]